MLGFIGLRETARFYRPRSSTLMPPSQAPGIRGERTLAEPSGGLSSPRAVTDRGARARSPAPAGRPRARRTYDRHRIMTAPLTSRWSYCSGNFLFSLDGDGEDSAYIRNVSGGTMSAAV